MAWLRKIWRLPAPDRFLLLQAIGLLAAIRVGLWLLPLGALRRLLRRATERRTTSGSGEPSKRRIRVGRRINTIHSGQTWDHIVVQQP